MSAESSVSDLPPCLQYGQSHNVRVGSDVWSCLSKGVLTPIGYHLASNTDGTPSLGAERGHDMSYGVMSDKDGHWVVNEDTGTRIALLSDYWRAVWLLKALETEGHTVRYAKPAQDTHAVSSRR